MRILTLHVNSIYVKAVKKAIKQAEEINDAFKKGISVNEALVVFIAIESNDNYTCISKLVENVKEIADSVKANKVVLYPYAHLSNDLAKPRKALELLKKARSELRKHFEVIAVPFGWYKAFSVDVKGHPLAELSRTITAEQIKAEEVSRALEAEKKAKSEWFIIDLEGKLHSIKLKNNNIVGFDFSKYKNLEKFARYEMKKVRAVDKQPIHVKLMRKLELVDYEPASDPGHFRFYPKGRLIKALLESWVNKNVSEYGGLEVETPIMYDIEHPALKSYLHRFPARQYTIQTPNKEVFLRFAACFGQFIMAGKAIISHKALPLRLYELTKYSFRVEQRGELTGLRRLRCFTMPDCHAICKDIEQAKQEMRIRFMLAKKVLEGIGFTMNDFELAIRVTKDFWNQNKDFVVSLVKAFGKPALLEMWDERFFYFVLKYELNFVDTLDKASALATDQIDVENAQRYGITYVDKDNKRKTPVILHLSPSGSVERVMYALLEKAWMQAEKTKSKPCLPLWLCPTQVRVVPVSEKYNEEAIEIARDLNENEKIRADVDDRDMQLSKKILEAEQEWVPYIVVLGEKELKQEVLTVRMRKENRIAALKPHELKEIIKKQTVEKPFKPLPLPMLLSKRPKFV